MPYKTNVWHGKPGNDADDQKHQRPFIVRMFLGFEIEKKIRQYRKHKSAYTKGFRLRIFKQNKRCGHKKRVEKKKKNKFSFAHYFFHRVADNNKQNGVAEKVKRIGMQKLIPDALKKEREIIAV